ncbi:MAG: class I SAM-dependent rRNA methyltransferase [Microthrixaceae bacterium]
MTPSRLAVRVTRDAARQVRGGHPWVFDGSVVSVKPDGAPGDLAVIFDDRRKFMAIGLYDPASPIRIKVLHAGSPTPIDDAFWIDRLTAALELRRRLVDDPTTTALRWVHGENDGLPGLVLDRYGDTTVVKLYSAAWFAHLDAVVSAAQQVLVADRVVLRLARNVAPDGARADATALVGELPNRPVRFLERGLTFEADVVHGQKTGHFLDQRDNRFRVRNRATGARVLDVYACTGGFSVNAAAGGAELVHSVDINAAAIATARRNMDHNRGLPAVRACHHHDTVGDAMAVMAEMSDHGRRFDLVVVDPPSFASRKDQVPGALRAYGRLTELALRLLEPGGTLVQASCSARVSEADFFATVGAAAQRHGVVLVDALRTSHAVDHPIGFPEGGYLKAVFATVERA